MYKQLTKTQKPTYKTTYKQLTTDLHKLHNKRKIQLASDLQTAYKQFANTYKAFTTTHQTLIENTPTITYDLHNACKQLTKPVTVYDN